MKSFTRDAGQRYGIVAWRFLTETNRGPPSGRPPLQTTDQCRPPANINPTPYTRLQPLRRQAIELAEARAFLRESLSELSQQVREAKAAAILREGGVPTPPRLLPQR